MLTKPALQVSSQDFGQVYNEKILKINTDRPQLTPSL